MSARSARAYIGSHRRSIEASAVAASGRPRRARAGRRPVAAGRASAAASRNRCHDRREPDRARRRRAGSTIRAASTAALSLARHRAVAPRPRDVDPVRREALLGDLDRVEPTAGDGHRHAAGFVDRAGRAQPVRPVLGDPSRPAWPARLLVRRAREQDVAAQAGDRIAGRIEAGGARLRDEPSRRRPSSIATMSFMSTAPRP